MTDTSSSTATNRVLKSVFPAFVLGLIGLFLFTLLAGLFASVGGPAVFSNDGFMATFGFFVGFGGRMAMEFESQI